MSEPNKETRVLHLSWQQGSTFINTWCAELMQRRGNWTSIKANATCPECLGCSAAYELEAERKGQTRAEYEKNWHAMFVYSTTRNHQLAGLTLEYEAADEAHAAAYEAWDVLDERFHRLYHPNCFSARLLDHLYTRHLRRHWNCPSPLWPGLELKFKESVGKNKKRDDLLRRRNAAYDADAAAREQRLAALKALEDASRNVGAAAMNHPIVLVSRRQP